MEGWKTEDLALIGDTDEIAVAAHASGQLTKPVPVWVVRVNDNLYVRSYRGHAGAWFRAAQASGQGRIWAGDEARDVAFVAETDPVINDQIDAAYGAKYGHSPYAGAMVAPEVRTTTLKLLPR